MYVDLSSIMKKRGRKKGSQDKGHFFRSGRGWFVTGNGPLKGEDGRPISKKNTPAAKLRLAYVRHLTGGQVDEPDTKIIPR